MSCSCIRGKDGFSFLVRSLSCKVMAYQDMSDWMLTPEHEIPTEYTIKVTSPSGFTNEILVQREGVNKLTSLELFGIPDVCLTDGVYCITTFMCGKLYTRYAAYTCNAECEVTNFLTKIDSPEDIELGIKVKSYIEAVHASANQGELNTAKDTYKVLKRLIDTLNCKY